MTLNMYAVLGKKAGDKMVGEIWEKKLSGMGFVSGGLTPK